MRYEIKRVHGKFVVYATDTSEHTAVDSEHDTLVDAERRVKGALEQRATPEANMDAIDYDAEAKKKGYAQDPDGKWVKVPQPGEPAAPEAAPIGPRGSRRAGGTPLTGAPDTKGAAPLNVRSDTSKSKTYNSAREVYEAEKANEDVAKKR